MILVQRPAQSIFAAGPVHHQHRRFPSAPAPALVAAATKTPGLLSLSRPQQPAQQHAQQRRASPKLKPRSPQPAPAVPALQPPAQIVDKQPAKVSQSPEKRGRQAAAGPKPRSVSNRRSKQAEPPSTPIATSKPFFDSFSSDSGPRLPVRSTPKLSPKPSGKLANRRRQDDLSLDTKSIPVPVKAKMPSLHKRASAPPVFRFPIRDDISEVGDLTTEDDLSPPTTPTQPKRSARRTQFDDGPKTAPLSFSASMPNFPFGTPAKKTTRRRHVRSPSEGVFQMSDEEVSTSSNGSSSDELNALFAGLLNQKQVMFASSTFLNSPDPEELPPPSF